MLITPIVYTSAGILLLLRGLFRGNRAVVRKGGVSRCSGPSPFGSCDPSDAIEAAAGTNAYSVASGRVMAVGQDFIHILVGNEPVILMYAGIKPTVVEGQYVGRGQYVGVVDEGGMVHFSVTELVRDSGPLGYVARAVPPSGWLAARGARHAVTNTGAGTKWCEGGREIAVPDAAATSCNMKRPEPGMFGLLPIRVEIG
jgi:hypothetical protein